MPRPASAPRLHPLVLSLLVPGALAAQTTSPTAGPSVPPTPVPSDSVTRRDSVAPRPAVAPRATVLEGVQVRAARAPLVATPRVALDARRLGSVRGEEVPVLLTTLPGVTSQTDAGSGLGTRTGACAGLMRPA